MVDSYRIRVTVTGFELKLPHCSTWIIVWVKKVIFLGGQHGFIMVRFMTAALPCLHSAFDLAPSDILNRAE